MTHKLLHFALILVLVALGLKLLGIALGIAAVIDLVLAIIGAIAI